MNPETATPNVPTVPEYEFSGTVRTRFQTLFIENETSHLVECPLTENGQAQVIVKEFTQTSDSMIDTLGADLTRVIDVIKFQVGERETLEKILNMNEIWENWQTTKARLMDKYKDIPDFAAISDSYGDNLRKEEKLLLSIENRGIYGLLFPQVKFMCGSRIPNEIHRTKIIKEGVLSKDLPMAEKVKIQKIISGEFLIEVKGELAREKFDYDGFLNTARQMFGGQVKAEDIIFRSTESYTLDGEHFGYTNGTRHHYLEIKNQYFRDDEQSFKLKD